MIRIKDLKRNKGEKKERTEKTEKTLKRGNKKTGRMHGGIELKIMLLVLVLVISAIGSIMLLVNNMNSIVAISNDIISNQVTQEEKVAELSRQYSYING